MIKRASSKSPLAIAMTVAAIVSILASGCGKPPQYAPAYGPKVMPLPYAPYCPNPVPAKLGFIITPLMVVPEANGSFLVADGGGFNRQGSKVVEFNGQGKPDWAYVSPNLSFVHSAYPTTRGNILIADTNNNRVIEVNRKCKLVWTTDFLGPGHGYLGRGRFSNGDGCNYPNSAQELTNGHYLISCRMDNRILEVDRDGKVWWTCSKFTNLQGKPDQLHGQHNPVRLANGDTLIADSDNARVVEVNPSCTKEVWQYGGLKTKHVAGGAPYQGQKLLWPRDAMEMNNHDILIDDSLHNRCLEVNRAHRIIRKYYGLPQPYSCWPMPNGTVASGDTGTHGIVLWGPGNNRATPMHFIPPAPANPGGSLPSRHLVNGGFEPVSSGAIPFGWQQDDLLSETLPPTIDANMGIDKNYDASQNRKGPVPKAAPGQSSARITWPTNTPHGPLFWSQTLRVHPFRYVTVSGWIAVNGVKRCTGCNAGKGTDPGDSAYLAVQLIRPGPYANPVLPGYPKIRGTTGSFPFGTFTPTWVKVSKTIEIQQGVKLMIVEGVLAGMGTAYFDDVTVLVTRQRPSPGCSGAECPVHYWKNHKKLPIQHTN